MRRVSVFFMAVSVVMLMISSLHAAPNAHERITKAFKGDLPEMLDAHRPLRVLVSYNRTNFFMFKGEARGMEVDSMRDFEKFLKKKYPKRMIRLAFVPVPFDDLLPALLDGRGDIVAAGMTVTEKRRRKVAFSRPYRKEIMEVVVGGKASPPIKDLADLAGKRIHVMAGSSYEEHLKRLNTQFEAQGLKPVDVVAADPNLVTEDLLEMVGSGLVSYVVADNQLVEIWQQVYTDLTPYFAASIHTGGTLAWAVRPGNIELLRVLNDFRGTVKEGSKLGNLFFKRYYVNTDWVKNPLNPLENSKLQSMADLFQKYAKKYDFDWLKIAAQAYQESHFDQNRKSRAGAVGVMQIKPSTAADPNVNVKDVYILENNIHAGVKYLRFLRDRYFQDVDADARVDFALAAYNAGPARIAGLRTKAKEMGLNPNRWFGNVEWAAQNVIGSETPTYVAHVQMYYATYKGTAEVLTKRIEAME
ncbi:transglycosylase SLT domain-containing protein [Pseudodesulfovibrio sediminis]|uniref:Peptidoglycan lytic exotransglycosylase n=1 Tax=Pseudodesulfovibrio sediminis TaxID=2810563 RepID=A0ABM7P830_9BACT|nr:transporter substrate-binding domain-containing protein [Pseudodesulfovibrio sediminis]BCS89081.1 peptidoglycan lytic exotransglycosylase [Pseudodesulfovibrio sediminis]